MKVRESGMPAEDWWSSFFDRAREKPVICFAQITNRMGSVENDFEKGEAQGSQAALELIDQAAGYWFACNPK